jgi:hypothetical protein
MPQPIHVALVGSTADIVRKAKRQFRLSEPGIGAAYLATMEQTNSDTIVHFDKLPWGLVTLWIALDHESFVASRQRHAQDSLNPRYSRGHYAELLPEACILVDFENSETASKKRLIQLAAQISKAWYASS